MYIYISFHIIAALYLYIHIQYTHWLVHWLLLFISPPKKIPLQVGPVSPTNVSTKAGERFTGGTSTPVPGFDTTCRHGHSGIGEPDVGDGIHPGR